VSLSFVMNGLVSVVVVNRVKEVLFPLLTGPPEEAEMT
jgi:hypothetical protein